MPTYTFKDLSTGEIKEIYLKISEYDKFVPKNQNLERIFLDAPKLADPYALGRIKPPSDFQKHIVGRIKTNNRGSSGSKRWEVPREF